MKLLKTTHEKINLANYRYQVQLSNSNKNYIPSFFALKESSEQIVVQVFENEINNDLVFDSVKRDQFIYKVFCNTRSEKRAIEKTIGKKLNWLDKK